MRPPESGFGVTNDQLRVAHDVSSDVAVSLPLDPTEGLVPAEVALAYLALVVHSSVVLMEASSPDDPEVAARDHVSPVVTDLVLRANVDAGPSVQQSQRRLPPRLRSIVSIRSASRSIGPPH
jgi:hypothetical protein